VRQSIRGYADGVIELTGTAPAVAPELRAVKVLLDSSEDLRRVLTDSGVPVASRRAVVQDLLGRRVSAPTIQLLDFALGADRASDFPDNVAWLVNRTEAAARDARLLTDHVLGHKAAEERLDGYAAAILAPVEGEAALTNVEDELFRFMRTVAASEELGAALSNRAVPQSARQAVVWDLLRHKASQATIRLAAYATQVGRPRDYEALLGFLVDRVASENNRRIADVRAPIELDDSQRRDLATALSRVLGRNVEVRVVVDPGVLGGFVATVGDTVVDGSARHRLEILKERLVLPEATITTGDT
jgi:F-type H+-transporting ATPase subunit delta